MYNLNVLMKFKLVSKAKEVLFIHRFQCTIQHHSLWSEGDVKKTHQGSPHIQALNLFLDSR